MRRTTMNLFQFQRRTSLALCFLALAGIVYGQAQQGAQFEPQVGQAGKDVVWVPTPQELVNKMLDLKPGTRIVSNTFTMGDWKADETSSVTENCLSWCTALLWIVPAKIDGTWHLAQGDLRLNQTFQEFSGTLAVGGNTTTITNGKIRGDELSFTAGSAQYSGRATANTITGTVKSGANSSNWRATR